MTSTAIPPAVAVVQGGAAKAVRRRHRLLWLMLAPALTYLAVFFLAPLYQIVRFSFGLSHLSTTDAIARIRGEQLGFTWSLWDALLGKGATLRVLGASLDVPLIGLALGLAALLAAALLGPRLRRGGTAVSAAGFVALALPFFTIPAGTTLLRVAQLRSDSQFLDLFFKSVSMAMTTSVFAVLIAFPVAYYLAFVAGPSRYTWLLVVIAPFFTSFFLRIIAWKVILGSSGLVNSGLFSLGVLEQGHPLSFLLYSQFTVIVVLVYAWAPFACMPMFVALEGVDRRVHEAAADLGASRLRILFKVTLPLAAPGLVAGFLFVFIPTIGEFVTPLLVGGTQGFMFGNEISDLFSVAIDWQTGSVLAVFLLAVVVLLTGSTSRFLRGQDL
ncbi:MAG TPA: ABC transporter permease [Solirubrobacteraceae bacterium]